MRAKLGQNFLVDPHWQKRIVDAFQPPNGFMEIGPGKGALTQHLAVQYQGFHVLELDKSLSPIHSHQSAYQLLLMNFLDWDFALEGRAVENFSLISNLPYESGTAILEQCLLHSSQIVHFVFMLQKEVIDRIMAKPNSRSFGALSVISQGQYDIELIGQVPPGAFSPRPKVQSAVIRASLRPEGERHPQGQEYIDFVRRAFSMKRKFLSNALKKYYPVGTIDSVYATLSLDPRIRAEQIELDLWPRLFSELNGS